MMTPVETIAVQLMDRRGFGWTDDPSEGGQDVYDISRETESEVRLMLELLAQDITPNMIAAGWYELRRAHLPRLGAGPGMTDAFRAMLREAMK